MSNASKTFRNVEKSQATDECAASDLVRVETVHASGLVEWSIQGTECGEYISKRGTREHGQVDLEKVAAARRMMGWVEV